MARKPLHRVYELLRRPECKGVVREMDLSGRTVDWSREIDKEEPYLDIVEKLWRVEKTRTRRLDVDAVHGRWGEGVRVIIQNPENQEEWIGLICLHEEVPDGVDPSALSARAYQNLDGVWAERRFYRFEEVDSKTGEIIIGDRMDVEDDDETFVIQPRRDNGSLGKKIVVAVRELWCEIVFNLAGTPVIEFPEFKTLIYAGSVRINPPLGVKCPWAVYYKYFDGRDGSRMRKGFAFPLDGDALNASVGEGEELPYEPPPEEGKFGEWRLTLHPIKRKVGRGNRQRTETVFMTIDERSGHEIRLSNRYELEPEEVGRELFYLWQEGRRGVTAIPNRRDPSKPISAQEKEEISALGKTLFEQDTSLDYGQYWFEGAARSTWKTLKRFGIDEKSSYEDVDRARKEMEKVYHEDRRMRNHPDLVPYAKLNVTPTDAVMKRVTREAGMFRTAFIRLLTVLKEDEELGATEGEEDTDAGETETGPPVLDPNDPQLKEKLADLAANKKEEPSAPPAPRKMHKVKAKKVKEPEEPNPSA